jgi:anti-sigma factor RsiW
MIIEIFEADLHAFLDGELDEAGIQRFTAAMDADPALRALAEVYRADRDRLRQTYVPLLEEPLPERFLRLVTEGAAPRRPAWHWVAGAGLVAAAAILMMVWLGPAAAPRDALLAEAIAVRDGAVAPEQQLAATAPSVERAALVTRTLETDVNIPDLDEEGYKLAGVGVYPDRSRGRAVQLNYRNGQGRLLTVYLRHPTGADRYEILPERDGKRVCIWESQELSTVIVGEMSEQEMLRTAALAYHALNF